MPRGEANVVQIVVLSARPHALLRAGGAGVVALLPAGEHVLELHHPGVGEEKRRVILGNEGGRSHAAVPSLLEETQECFAKLN